MDHPLIFPAKMPPRHDAVKIYFSQKGIPEAEASTFFSFYENKFWMNKKGIHYKEWKRIARRWITAYLKENPWMYTRNLN